MKTFENAYAARFAKGSRVRVAPREALLRFQREWSSHHPLLDAQVEHAGRLAEVGSIAFDQEGEPLYALHGIAGVWHECCLEPVTPVFDGA